MRHLMTEHAEIIGAAGQGIVGRIDGALEFAEKLLGTNPLYSRANPQYERSGLHSDPRPAGGPQAQDSGAD